MAAVVLGHDAGQGSAHTHRAREGGGARPGNDRAGRAGPAPPTAGRRHRRAGARATGRAGSRPRGGADRDSGGGTPKAATGGDPFSSPSTPNNHEAAAYSPPTAISFSHHPPRLNWGVMAEAGGHD